MGADGKTAQSTGRHVFVRLRVGGSGRVPLSTHMARGTHASRSACPHGSAQPPCNFHGSVGTDGMGGWMRCGAWQHWAGVEGMHFLLRARAHSCMQSAVRSSRGWLLGRWGTSLHFRRAELAHMAPPLLVLCVWPIAGRQASSAETATEKAHPAASECLGEPCLPSLRCGAALHVPTHTHPMIGVGRGMWCGVRRVHAGECVA
jgi:hypothetical protein